MAASDQTTFSGLTQLTAPSTSDRLVIEDDSANETKYISPNALIGYGRASIYATTGQADSLGSISDWTQVTTFDTNGSGEGSTADQANNQITLLNEAGVYLIMYQVTAYSSATCVMSGRLTQDGTALPDSYTAQADETTGANGTVTVHGHSLFVATGGEAIAVEIKPSTTATVTVDACTLTVLRVG